MFTGISATPLCLLYKLFTTISTKTGSISEIAHIGAPQKISGDFIQAPARGRAIAPPLRHTPVRCLHSAEYKAVTSSYFSLTPKMKGVKQTRSLTTSEVFPVGAASGARAKSHSHRKMTREG